VIWAYTRRVPDPSRLAHAAGITTVAILVHCSDCERPLNVSYEFQGRERKNVYRCPHCLQLGQVALPGPIVAPIGKA